MVTLCPPYQFTHFKLSCACMSLLLFLLTTGLIASSETYIFTISEDEEKEEKGEEKRK